MHNIEKEIIQSGIIDTPIECIQIDEWFENMTLVYKGIDMKRVVCEFKNCFEISLKHDKAYSKSKKKNGELDYKYFVQNVEVCEKEGFLYFAIDAWPLEGKIVCKKIAINVC